MSNRRSFLAYAVGMLSATAVAQQEAVMVNGSAKVCEGGDPVKCPLGHKTCRTINAPVVVGNDNYQNPDVGQLRDYHLMRCDVCHVLFTLE